MEELKSYRDAFASAVDNAEDIYDAYCSRSLYVGLVEFALGVLGYGSSLLVASMIAMFLSYLLSMLSQLLTRRSAIKAVSTLDLAITQERDITPIEHARITSRGYFIFGVNLLAGVLFFVGLVLAVCA